MTPPEIHDYDTVELRTGRLQRIHRSQGRALGEQDGMTAVVKCYCRTLDVITSEDAELQRRPTFVFPALFFENLEGLIGKELEGRLYRDSLHSRVRFYLDLKEHAGFQLEDDQEDLLSPWYDEGVLKE